MRWLNTQIKENLGKHAKEKSRKGENTESVTRKY